MNLIETALNILSEDKGEFKTFKSLLDSFDYTKSMIHISHGGTDIGLPKPTRKTVEEYIKNFIKEEFVDTNYMRNEGQGFKGEYDDAFEMFFKLIQKSFSKYYNVGREIKGGGSKEVIVIRPKIRDSRERYTLLFKTLKNKVDSDFLSDYKEYHERYTGKKL